MANDYWQRKLSQLVDGKIISVIVDKTVNEFSATNEPFIGLRIEMPDGKIKDMWLLSDEEGNAPGRFIIV
jgi:hypothetical protein